MLAELREFKYYSCIVLGLLVKLPQGTEYFKYVLENNPDFSKGIKTCIESLDKDVTNSIFWALNSLSTSRNGAEILIKSEFIQSLKD